MNSELVFELAGILAITNRILIIGMILMVVVLVWELVSKWNIASMIAQIVISVIIFLVEVTRLVTEIYLSQNWIISIFILIVMCINVTVRILFIKDKKKFRAQKKKIS